MDILHYYELKQKYEEALSKRKMKIKKSEEMTIKEKRSKIKKIIPKCVNCGKPGGTLFEEKNGTLNAVCAVNPPCDLNINIKRKLYDNMRDMEIKNDKTIEHLKMRIIMTKLDYLFGLNTSKEEIVEKFNTLKSELSNVMEAQLVLNKNYGDIISGINRDPLLSDANMELATEMAEMKKIYDEYVLNPKKPTAYLTSMVEKYITIILPLTEQIKKIKYAYYDIEVDSAKGKEEIYTLYALPYKLSQIEQEQK